MLVARAPHLVEAAHVAVRLPGPLRDRYLSRARRRGKKVMAQLGVAADSMWFFADSRPNVKAAERLGIKSFLVDEVPAVQRVLKAEGSVSGRHARHAVNRGPVEARNLSTRAYPIPPTGR